MSGRDTILYSEIARDRSPSWLGTLMILLIGVALAGFGVGAMLFSSQEVRTVRHVVVPPCKSWQATPHQAPAVILLHASAETHASAKAASAPVPDQADASTTAPMVITPGAPEHVPAAPLPTDIAEAPLSSLEAIEHRPSVPAAP